MVVEGSKSNIIILCRCFKLFAVPPKLDNFPQMIGQSKNYNQKKINLQKTFNKKLIQKT